MEGKINIGDIVQVNFNNAQYTLCKAGRVVHMPCDVGDSWIIRDKEKGMTYYISEGCTISKTD